MSSRYVCTALIVSNRYSGWLRHIGVGFCVARSCRSGQCETPESVGRVTGQQPHAFFVSSHFRFLHFFAVTGWRQAIEYVKMANVFMAQTHFFFPLERVGNKARKKLKERGNVIPIGFTSQRNEMLSRFVALEEQTFYYASRTKNGAECFRRILIKTYLVSFRLSNQDTEDFFLVAGTSIDKCFEESYAEALPNSPNQSFTERICTERDLVYLQETLRRNAKQSLFFPLHDRTLSFRQWIDRIAQDLTEKKSCNSLLPEYSVIHVRGVEVNIGNVSDTEKLDREKLDSMFNAEFYSMKNVWDFDEAWHGDYTRLALALTRGNANMHNISRRQVEEFKSNAFTNNRVEMNYASRDGLVFFQSHHPYDIHITDELDKIVKSWSDDLSGVQHVGVQHVYEICLPLSIKRKLRDISNHLDYNNSRQIRIALAKLSKMIEMQYINVVDIDREYHFILEKMGITSAFEQLRQRGELLADADHLRLSRITNIIVVIFTVSAFVAASLQIIQNHINTNSSSMKDVYITVRETCCHNCQPVSSPSNCPFHLNDDSIVLQILFVTIVLVVLIVSYHFVLYPIVKQFHERLHRDMDIK